MQRASVRVRAAAATALCAAAAAFVFAAPADADEFAVTNTADSGPGSLRAAVTSAVATPTFDQINITATGTINLTSPLPAMTGQIFIFGPGAQVLEVRRQSGDDSPVFEVSPNAYVRLHDMEISGGNESGISSFGQVGLSGVHLRGNSSPLSGGGVFLGNAPGSRLIMQTSTITGNTVDGVNGGGGIYAAPGTQVNITSSTITGNSTTAGRGGGITALGDGRVDLSTIARNTVAAAAAPQNLANVYATSDVDVFGSLVADPLSSNANPVANCGGGFASLGRNLADDNSCFNGPNDLPVADPGFLQLTDSKPFLLPIPLGSPASNAFPSSSECSALTDQRGVQRGQGSGCDVGAFENEVLPRLAFSNPAPIAISALGPASPFPSQIAVSGLTRPITEVTVRLHGLHHTYTEDVAALLVGPGGQTVQLMQRSPDGGRDSILTTLTFDDDGVAIPGAGNLPTGTYKPTSLGSGTYDAPAPVGPYGSSLSVFDGTLANGTWKLFIQDQESGDGGSLGAGWSLGIETQPPPQVEQPTPTVTPPGPTPPKQAKKCKKPKKGKKAGAAAKCKKPKKK